MAYCGKCGTKVDEGTKFCLTCGNALEASAEEKQTPPAAEKTEAKGVFQKLMDTPETTAEFDPADIAANKTMGILAYIGPLCFVPMFAAKGSRYARFHANQGLILLIACGVWSVAYSILNWILLAISWRLAFISTLIGLLSVVFVLLAVFGIINVAKGKAKELPLIGKFKLLK